MKKTITMILGTVATAFALRAYGGTTHTFCQYLGDVASPSQAQLTSYAAFLSNNSVDFGVFYGASSTAGFGLTAEGYTAVTTVTSGYPGRTLVYKTSEWEIVQYYDLAIDTSHFMQIDAYVMKRKSTEEKFVFTMPTCTKNSGLGKAAGPDFVRGKANGWGNSHPTAIVLMAAPFTKGLTYEKTNEFWNASMTNNHYVRTLRSSSTGTIFAKTNNVEFTHSGAAVTRVAAGDSHAATAVFTRRAPCKVTFLDWDGTELKTETVLEGNDATPPADPKRTDYVFAGWNGSYQNIQANVTLTARYDLENSPGMIMMCW